MGDRSNRPQLATPPESPIRQRNPRDAPEPGPGERNDAEIFLMGALPKKEHQDALKRMFTDVDEELRTELQHMGLKGEELADKITERRTEYNNLFNGMIQMNGGTLPIYGNKPEPGDKIRTIDLPGSSYMIRLSDGGLRDIQQYLLDFVDRVSLAPVDVPDSYAIYRLTEGPGSSKYYRLQTWEEAIDPDASIQEGEGRYSVREGVTYRAEYPVDHFVEFIPPIGTERAENLVQVGEAVQR
ncbi:hypothetical protein EVJ58_g8252 [Rhodofomes roseus]|uniref:Uncharacterized protein n=1 Tax=Rhodofomes roseus TaxID=34475 RepID=A0A4Y9Y223_9APHY|nr:hypothetical protein EVJ58_g8252 [Rhodofomes roseus]